MTIKTVCAMCICILGYIVVGGSLQSDMCFLVMCWMFW